MAAVDAGRGGRSRRPLVLHFDINKTIIMCDPAKGVSCDEMVNSFLSEACWGTWDGLAAAAVDAEAKLLASQTWKLEQGPAIGRPKDGLVSYAELLEEILKMDKPVLQELKSKFTETGSPGEAVREVYDGLQEKLQLPAGVTLPTAPASMDAGRHFIVPSFFRLLLHLEREGRDFRVIFRTFGVDTEDVVAEFNLFCQGSHPLFEDSPVTLERFVLELPRQSGQWLRDDDGLRLRLHGCDEVCGYVDCAAALRRKLFHTPEIFSLALRDCYPHWRKCGEADDSGKPACVDPPTDTSPHTIFFDDNIEHGRAHIVDARDAGTGESIPFSEARGVYLVKAEPVLAIQDPSYFIKAVAAAEEALERRLAVG